MVLIEDDVTPDPGDVGFLNANRVVLAPDGSADLVEGFLGTFLRLALLLNCGAVALVPQAHEGWIGIEQVHQAHAQVLRALGRLQEAEEQERLAAAIVETKANCIPDLEQRQRYLESQPLRGLPRL